MLVRCNYFFLTLVSFLFLSILPIYAQADSLIVQSINRHCIVGVVNAYGANFNLGPDCATYTGPNTCSTGSGPLNGVNKDYRGVNAVTWLVNELQSLYDLGVKKVFINRPMGGSGVSHVTGAAWKTIPEYKRTQLVQQLKPWLDAHSDFVLGIFIGSRWIKTDSLMGYIGDGTDYPGNTKGFDPLVKLEKDTWHEVFDPWYNIGIRWALIDFASNDVNKDWLLRLGAYEMNLRGVEITGEAIPATQHHNRQGSWIAKAPVFIDSPQRPHANVGLGGNDSNTTWYAWLNTKDIDTSLFTTDQYIQSLINRGYVVAAGNKDISASTLLRSVIDTCVTLEVTGMTAQVEAQITLALFPNPSSDEFVYTIVASQGQGKQYNVKVTNGLGKLIFSENIVVSSEKHRGIITVTHYNSGYYTFTVTDNTGGKQWNKKILVQNQK